MLDQSLFPNFIARSEIKLRLTAEEADIFAAEIKRHLPVYCYSPGRETTFVTTVYFDTDDFRFYSRANKFRDDNLKLRLKEYYYEVPEGYEVVPECWIEVKRRLGEATSKHRFRVAKVLVQRLFAGEDCFNEIYKSNRELAAEDVRKVFDTFLGVVRTYDLRPYSITNYRRRTFQAAGDESIRVTIDDLIAYFRAPALLYNGFAALTRGVLGEACGQQKHTVVEIKTTRERPAWMLALLDRFPQSHFSKFLTSTQALLRGVQGAAMPASDIVVRGADETPRPRLEGEGRRFLRRADV